MGIFSKIGSALGGIGQAVGGYFGGTTGSSIGGAIGSALGGFGASKAANEQFEKNAALQKEFAQHGIRWRVEDAKAAGVHPLYALGAGGAAFAPITIGSQADSHFAAAGQNLSRAVAASSTATENEMVKAQLDLLRAQTAKETAIANSYSTPRIANQPGQTPFPDISHGPVDMTNFYNKANINAVNVDSMSDVPGIAAGPAGPGMYLHNFGGQPLLLPGKDVSEALESLSESPLLMGIVYKANVNHFGEDYMDKFMRGNVPFGSEALAVRDAIRGLGEGVAENRMWWQDWGDKFSRGWGERNRKMDWLKKHGLSPRTVWTGTTGGEPWNRR